MNTKIVPFQNAGKVCDGKLEKCGENGWKSEFTIDKDIHLIGINVRRCNVKGMT